MKFTQQHLFSTKITPETGRLLIAEPFLNELYFQRAVILLVHHDNDESMGLVLNHPSETHTHEILNDFDFSMRISHKVVL
jgi:putative transcriptional regulator